MYYVPAACFFRITSAADSRARCISDPLKLVAFFCDSLVLACRKFVYTKNHFVFDEKRKEKALEQGKKIGI